MLSFLIGLCYSMVNLAYRTIDEARNFTVPGGLEATPWLATLKASGWLAVIGGPVVPFFIYLGLDFMMKLRLLPTQLHTFDARKARCYCCTVPGTLFKASSFEPVSGVAICRRLRWIIRTLTRKLPSSATGS